MYLRHDVCGKCGSASEWACVAKVGRVLDDKRSESVEVVQSKKRTTRVSSLISGDTSEQKPAILKYAPRSAPTGIKAVEVKSTVGGKYRGRKV